MHLTSSLLACLAVLGGGVSAFAQTAVPPETIGKWRFAAATPDGRRALWVQANGTAATPDLCAAAMAQGWPEKFSAAELAAFRGRRTACLLLTCKPEAEGRPPRYDLALILYGDSVNAEHIPAERRKSGTVMLRLNDGPLVFPTGLTAPIYLEPGRSRIPSHALNLVHFSASPLARTAMERILRSSAANVPAIKGHFGAYITVMEMTIGAYEFDLAGGAEALSRLDAHCR